MSKRSDYLRLMRISLLPTAWSNVLMGFVLVAGLPTTSNWLDLVLLLICSSCLYVAGMVLNDVFDVELDRIERPERVLPSGKIKVADAKAFGFSLLAAAFVVGLVKSLDYENGGWTFDSTTLLVVLGLIVLILFYNLSAKRLMIGPVIMGLCRTGNVLLGCSISSEMLTGRSVGAVLYVAFSIGAYVAGITWLAKNENENRFSINRVSGAVVMLIAIGVLVCFPLSTAFSMFTLDKPAPSQPMVYAGLLLIVMAPVVRRVVVALITKEPQNIKLAVISSLLTIILIDASLCYLVVATRSAYALGVACLIIPAFLMCRRIMAT